MTKLVSSREVSRDMLYNFINEGYLEIVNNFSFIIANKTIHALTSKCNKFLYPFGCTLSHTSKKLPYTDKNSDVLFLKKRKHANMYPNIEVTCKTEHIKVHHGSDQQFTITINKNTEIEILYHAYTYDMHLQYTTDIQRINTKTKKDIYVSVIVKNARKFKVDNSHPLIYNALMVGEYFQILACD